MYIAGRIFLRKIPPAHGVENTCDENVPNPHLTPQKNNLHSENIPVKNYVDLPTEDDYLGKLICVDIFPGSVVFPGNRWHQGKHLSLSLSLLPPASLPRMNG